MAPQAKFQQAVEPPQISSEIVKFPVDRIVVDHRVQRAQLVPSKLDTIVANYDPHALGVVVLSVRANGTAIALDGWHRTEATKLVDWAPREIDAKVFHNLTLADEARYFRLYNTRTAVHTIDAFNAGVFEGVETSVEITKMVESYGLIVHANSFACVAAATRIVRFPDGYKRLDRVLHIIGEVWAFVDGSLDYRIVEGLATFIRYHGDNVVKTDTMVKRLKEMPLDSKGQPVGFRQIVAEATAYHKAKGGPVRLAVADVIAKYYNKFQQDERKLPDIPR